MAAPSTPLTIAGRPLESLTGYGLMGFTWRPNPVSQTQAFAAMRAALAHGANLWNGGELYGSPERNSLHLLREYFTQYPADAARAIIQIKGAGPRGGPVPIDSGAANVSRSIETCLRVLAGAKHLDIWEPARLNPATPIEVTMRAAKPFLDRGQISGIALSEASAATIRRAAAVVPIAAVEVEVSLWATEIFSNGVAATCAELHIPIVAYSPLGRGFLTGELQKPEDLAPDDRRRALPRFTHEHFFTNLALVHEVEAIAQRKGVKPARIALAWVHAKSRCTTHDPRDPILIPIPGATTEARVAENAQAPLVLSAEEVREIDALVAKIPISGGRYAASMEAGLFVETVEEGQAE